jgi:uncharacterized 2Fe-2S/4Fe-4S cluster protein (DUF4445 family)
LMAGTLTHPTVEEESIFTAEELEDGWRLACQAEPLDDVKIDIPPESLTTPQRLQIEGETGELEIDPAVSFLDVQIDPPTLHDLRADAERLNDAVLAAGGQRLQFSLPVLTSFSTQARALDWSLRLAIADGHFLAGVLPLDSPLFGLAVDIGTTSIAAYLVDLETGGIAGKAGAMNPQIAYGEDVISRILYIDENQEGKELLQGRVVNTLEELLSELCAEAGASREQIVDAVIVGNTAMHHIFAGLPVKQLGEAPYVPSVGGSLQFPARAVGLTLAPGAAVYMPPNIAGYVGADHMAMLAATDIWRTERTTIAVDIGTNTEVTLVHNGRRFSCSCASGPAFEGAHISAGMRAAPGAIERVQIIDDQVRVQTIGDQAAVGICGSGVLDAVAVMVDSELINHRGAMEKQHDYAAILDDGQAAFVLVPAEISGNGRNVAVNRKDVAEIQLAKGAIRAGIEILLKEARIPADEVEDFVIAGAFGTYIDVASAVRIGMFPALPLDRFRQVGNAAGMGARLLLISQGARRRAAEMVEQIEYVELTTYDAFQDEFIRQLSF